MAAERGDRGLCNSLCQGLFTLRFDIERFPSFPRRLPHSQPHSVIPGPIRSFPAPTGND